MILIVLGSLMHAAVRDRFPFPLALAYYGLPRPVLLGLALLASLVAMRFSLRMFWLGVALIFGVLVWQRDFEQHAELLPAAATDHNVVFWNVGRDLTDDVAAVDEFLESGAVLVGLVETGDLTTDWLDAWRRQHPAHQLVPFPNNCLLAVRGRLLEQGEIPLPLWSSATWADVEIQGTVVRVMIVDLVADLWVSRRDALLKLAETLDAWGNRPVIVMGDFNCPDESVWFEHFPEDYREVFRAAGSGYAPTWPWPCPVLKLDQMWVSRRVRIGRAWQTGTWRSDHRIVQAELDWAAEPPE